MITETTIQLAKECDLTEVIGQFVRLKKQGVRYLGLCPFHDEKTPSFVLTPGKGFKCFGCGEGGRNAIDFIMRYEGTTFPEAVLRVCGIAGILHGDSISDKNKGMRNFNRMTIDQIDYLPFEIMEKSVSKLRYCNLYPFLSRLFRDETATQLCENYFVGSNKNGDTVFWQVDIAGKVRQAKVIEYNSYTGKRNRDRKAFFAGKQILNR